MKAIINGKRYDTAKARMIGESRYGSQGDFSAWHAALYQSPLSKTFFLAGWGGPMTIFASKTAENRRSSGEAIIPLTTEDALAWAEQHLPVEIIEANFDVKDA